MTLKSNTVPDAALFSTKKVQKAIRSLEPILGPANVLTLIYDLENYGVGLANDRDTYNLADIQKALEKIFGEEAMMLLLRHITKELFDA